MTSAPNVRELENRYVLRRLARELDAAIALPRSPYGRWVETPNSEWALDAIHSCAATCFPHQRYGIAGFSDGGYLVNDFFSRCTPTGADWLVSVAGEGTLQPNVRDLSRCGVLRMIGGRGDVTFESMAEFARGAAKRHANVRFVEHDGGHSLPFDETRDVLRELMK